MYNTILFCFAQRLANKLLFYSDYIITCINPVHLTHTQICFQAYLNDITHPRNDVAILLAIKRIFVVFELSI